MNEEGYGNGPGQKWKKKSIKGILVYDFNDYILQNKSKQIIKSRNIISERKH